MASNDAAGHPAEATAAPSSTGSRGGSSSSGRNRTSPWAMTCPRGDTRRHRKWAYRYPANNVVWKKTKAVFQTAGLPP